VTLLSWILEMTVLTLDLSIGYFDILIHYFHQLLTDGNRNSSVNIVSSYGLDHQAIEVRSPAEVRGFFL
jgi:hypothetical protein